MNNLYICSQCFMILNLTKTALMKFILIQLFVFISLSSVAQFNRDPYRDSDEGNFYLRNTDVYFQKTYNSSINFEALEQKLKSYNTPGAGFQVKKTDDNSMNGVILNYNLNWNYKDLKSRKIADFLKNPLNATFEVEKNGNAYQVTVRSIWFADVEKPSNKRHLTLESIVTGKDGVVFTKNKKDLEALKMIDENFQWIFLMQGSTQDTRF